MVRRDTPFERGLQECMLDDLESIGAARGLANAYRRAYDQGWRAGRTNPDLKPEDLRGETDAWYDGYQDRVAGRHKWTRRR